MTKLQLEAQIAALQAELAAQCSAAHVDVEHTTKRYGSIEWKTQSGEPLNDDASVLDMFGINWKTFAAKVVIGFGYNYLVSKILFATLAAFGIATWPVLVAMLAHVAALALSIYVFLLTAGTVADFVVDTVPAHAVSAYHATTRWLSGAARTTQSFASEQFARVVH